MLDIIGTFNQKSKWSRYPLGKVIREWYRCYTVCHVSRGVPLIFMSRYSVRHPFWLFVVWLRSVSLNRTPTRTGGPFSVKFSVKVTQTIRFFFVSKKVIKYIKRSRGSSSLGTVYVNE